MLRTRIAPTPSGFLHIGNLYSFVLTWLIAKKQNGVVVLRIDDLDAERVRPAYLEDIFKMLDFIGLQPHEGPSGVADFHENFSQSLRLPLYFEIKKTLETQQLLFACECSRSLLNKQSKKGWYPGTCLTKKLQSTGSNNAFRLKVDPGIESGYFDEYAKKFRAYNLADELGEFVIWRKDGLPAYHLTSVADDIHFGINFIVRGEDLALSSAAQKYLATKAGALSFEKMRWFHHPLALNEAGGKLSKSAGAKSASGLALQGASKSVIIRKIASMLNLPEKPYNTLNDLADFFDF